MNKVLRVISVLVLLFCLVLIRAFEDYLFYDPLLYYFEGSHLTASFPSLDVLGLLGSYTFRYSLNALLSLAILKTSFPKNSFFKTVAFFYFLAFLILMLLFFTCVVFKIPIGNLLLFYIRRFIIQPVFILLLFPLLYMLKKGYRFDDL